MEIKTFYISNKITKIKLSDIKVKKRIKFKNLCDDEISSLAASIKKNGLIEPIYVRRDIENTKKYILVDGLRRLNAFEFLGAKNITFSKLIAFKRITVMAGIAISRKKQIT